MTTQQVTLTIDGQQVTVPAGITIVDAARLVGIDIPVFCYHPKMEPVGMCRMCLVEVGLPERDRETGEVLRNEDGSPKIRFFPKLQTACTMKVQEGMVVVTNSEQVARARKDILEFLLTSHPLDCPICDKGGECPLQNLTMAYGPGTSRFPYEFKLHLEKRVPLGDLIILDRERCIICGRCVRFQEEIAEDPVLALDGRGRATYIITTSDPPFDSYWSGNTTDICPVGALTTTDFRFDARPWEMFQAASVCNLCPVGCNIVFDIRREPELGGRFAVQRVMPRQNEYVNEIWICDKGRFAAYHFAQYGERLTQPLVRENGQLRPATWQEALEKVVQAFRSAGAGLVTLASGRLSNEDLFNLARLTDHLGGRKVLDTFLGGGEWTEKVGLGAGHDPSRWGEGDVIVVVASDLEEEAPVLWLRVKEAAKRGATLVVMNPRPTKIERHAAHVVRYRYGEESKALMDLMEEGGWWAQRLQEARNLIIIYGQEGMDLPRSTALAQTAAHVLLTAGHAGKPDSGLVAVWPRNNDQGAWDMGFRPVDNLADTLRAAKALYVVAADPAGDDPHLAAALSEAGFLVVQDLFLTETARRADVVLPAQAYIERGGTYTNLFRRVQRFYPAVPAPEGPQPDYAIAAALARMLDLELEGRSTASIMEQVAAAVPAYREVTYEALAKTEPQFPPVSREFLHYMGTAYENTQGLGATLPNAVQRGETVEAPGPAQVEAAATEGLMAVPITRLYDRGTLVTGSDTLAPRLPQEAWVWLAPETARGLGLEDGDQAVLEYRGLSQWVRIRVNPAVPGNVMLVPRSMGVAVSGPESVRIKAATHAGAED